MWEKCPVCDGKGHVENANGNVTCNVCQGQGIINSSTGSAPKVLDEVAKPNGGQLLYS